MDGTLTVAVHDFDAIRRELGLPHGQPILEALAQLPAARAAPLHQRLDEIELELALEARPQPGALDLLASLERRGARLGILTRNSEQNAAETLRAAGLARFFAPEFVIGRESCAPKPSPEGVNLLLGKWDAEPPAAVVVGDYVHDLRAGRGAGVSTVYFDPGDSAVFTDEADWTVRRLSELHSDR